MTLFRLDASIAREGSRSRAIADLVEEEWTAGDPSAVVVRRSVGLDPVPATAWAAAVSGAGVAEGARTPEQRAAAALAAAETDALLDADAALFAVPLYNFGISQHMKSWVDLVITDPRLGPGGAPATEGLPAVLVTVRGGSYAAGTPREGWDHARSWLRRILEDVWKMDLLVVEQEFTLVGVNPALDGFRDVADQLREEAERTARQHGRTLAGRRPRRAA